MTTPSARALQALREPVVRDSALAVSLALAAGLELSEAEREHLDRIFAIKDGKPATFDVSLSGPGSSMRRVLSTAALAWLFIEREARILWVTRSWDFAHDAFLGMRDLISGYEYLARRTKRAQAARGDEVIETIDGTRLLFRSVQGSGHRGLSMSRLILDDLPSNEQLPTLLPTLVGRDDAQVVTATSESSPEG